MHEFFGLKSFKRSDFAFCFTIKENAKSKFCPDKGTKTRVRKKSMHPFKLVQGAVSQRLRSTLVYL